MFLTELFHSYTPCEIKLGNNGVTWKMEIPQEGSVLSGGPLTEQFKVYLRINETLFLLFLLLPRYWRCMLTGVIRGAEVVNTQSVARTLMLRFILFIITQRYLFLKGIL